MMNEQEQFWAGEFGDEYTKRNQVDWRARMQFWRDLISFPGIASAHEVGCNAGWNLTAIRSLDPRIKLTGNDMNECALNLARAIGFQVINGDHIVRADLVFTCGVLIHIAPENLRGMMENIVAASRRYVLAVEYEDDGEVEVEYRGHANKLWRRTYGRLYEELGLRLVMCERSVPGFDNCTAWLLEKAQ